MRKNKLFCILVSMTMLVAAGVHVSHNAGYVNEPVVAEAATVNYEISATFTGTSSSGITLPEGWTGQIRSTSKGSNGTYYATVKKSNNDYIQSPDLVNSTGQFVSNSVSFVVNAACNDSSAANTIDVTAHTEDGTTVGTETISTATGKAFSDMSGTIESSGGKIAYLQFSGSTNNTSKNITYSSINITYSEEIADENSTKVDFYIDGVSINTAYYSAGESVDYYPSEKEHFSFDGWYLDAEFVDKLADDYVVDGTVTTLYARWVEDAKYTINYHLNAETAESVVLYVGSTLDYVPVSDTLGFNGWYFDEELTEVVPGDYTVSEDIDLYASWSELTYSIDPSNLTEEAVTDKLTNNLVHFQGTIFTVTRGIKIDSSAIDLPDGTTSTHRLNMGGASKWTDGDASQRTVEFTAPSDGTLTVVFASGTSGRELVIREDGSEVLRQGLEATNTGEVATLEVTEGKFYQVGAGANIYLYQVTFTPKGAEVAPTAAINYQYDNDETPTAVRFIGTVANVDLTTVDSITLHFVKDGVAANKDVQVYTLYTSVAGQAEFAEVANTYYVVYVLNGVQSVLNQSLEVTMTVTFNNDAEALVATRTFTLGA